MNAADIERLLKAKLSPTHMELLDEGDHHVGHMQMSSGGHFRVTIVTSAFEGKSLVDRHRMIYEAVEMGQNPAIHALAIRAFTPEEWKRRDGTP
jgi:BolA protein